MTEHETPVLVAGGSLVGMFMAALLARHGISPLVVERHPGSAIHPRAAMIYQRTMEIIRALGIEDPVRQESYRRFEPDGAIMSVESIAGNELNWDIPTLNEFVKDLSPTERLFITQNALEPMLGPRARALGADIRFNTELVSFAPDADGVSAVIRDRATKRGDARARAWLIGADGNRSTVRQQLGIADARPRRAVQEHHHLLPRRHRPAHARPQSERHHGAEREVPRLLPAREAVRVRLPRRQLDWRSRRAGLRHVEPERDECLALVKSGLGVDTPVTIDSIQKWECMADVADRFRDGRVFLAGDAAHLMPPYGGFGGNTGIQDAQNLAWKLALVLQGAGRSGAARHLRDRAASGGGDDRRAGAHALRAARRAAPGAGRHVAVHQRRAHRPGLPLPVGGDFHRAG